MGSSVGSGKGSAFEILKGIGALTKRPQTFAPYTLQTLQTAQVLLWVPDSTQIEA